MEPQKELEKKKEVLNIAISQIEKQFGKGTILKLGSVSKTDTPGISTSSLALDLALGGQGIPYGRVTEIFGQESSGKTTVCLHLAANVQKTGGVAAYIDVEHALDPKYAQRIGVKLEDLYISQPDYGEQALEIADQLIRSGAVDLVIIDSVAALVPKAELEGDMGDQQMALQARLMSQALRKLTSSLGKSKSCVVFTNQLREKVGLFFGNPEITPGGRALKFFSSCRIELRRTSILKENERAIGINVKAKVVKNKVAPPHQEAEVEIYYDKGISRESDIINLGVKTSIINKSGAWVSYKDIKLGQGLDKARLFLEENQKVAKDIEKDILDKYYNKK